MGGHIQFSKVKAAFSRSLSSHYPLSPSSIAESNIPTIVSTATKCGRPVSIFPEMVRTNGQGIIAFSPALLGLEKVQSGVVHIIAFEYRVRKNDYRYISF
jgi:hypothetical protein